VHCLVTSRPEQNIQSVLEGLVSETSKISIQSDLVSGDISLYINTKVREGEGLKRWRHQIDVQQEIKDKLKQKANSM
jgi:predicted transcriptional regulator